MTNGQTQAQNLENILKNIGDLQETLGLLNNAKNVGERTNFYNLASLLINGEESGPNHDRVIKELTRDPQYAQMEIDNVSKNRANAIKTEYEANKNVIKDQIQNYINNTLKEAGSDKAQAAMMLVAYLNDILIKTPDITQDQADQNEKGKVKGMGFKYAFEAKGSVSEIKGMQSRLAASEYLKENTDAEGKVSYTFDSEKLDEVMKDIPTTAHLYTRAKLVEERKQRQH